ncbi:dienelactone hydrolase family protein [Flagellimonas lutimaris]|uniref:dienelactone hydrolase family protein n=1 Tax=Flagellimonas lutimaris TaxID=475082 RepID=UPI003F5CD9AE
MKLFPNTSENLKLLGILCLCAIQLSCSNDENNFPFGNDVKEVMITTSTKDTIVNVLVDNFRIPVYLSIPDGCSNSNFPAVVVLHGSGGMWKNDDPQAGILSSQYNEWRSLLAENCMVSAFVDSYSGRGVTERTGKWTTAPGNFKISSQFVRPGDANAALELLRKMKYSDGTSVIRPTDIGLLGFSDGATALMSTLYDTNAALSGWEWSQSFDGKDYDGASGVMSPIQKPEQGFAGGVFYYGGSSGYGYWGTNPCKENALEENIYFPYAPILYQIPEDGYLTENTLCMYSLLQQKGADVQLNLYQNAGHGFDTDGSNQSIDARTSTIDWFKNLLNMNQ